MNQPELFVFCDCKPPAKPLPPAVTRYSVREVRLACLHESEVNNPTLDTPERAVAFWREVVIYAATYRPDVENFVVLHVNTRRRIKTFEVISNGTLDTLLVHPREVFKSALVANAAAIILGHNHPSGDPSPSEADIKITRDLIRAGQLLKVDVLDSIVMGEQGTDNKGYASLRELGYFYS